MEIVFSSAPSIPITPFLWTRRMKDHFKGLRFRGNQAPLLINHHCFCTTVVFHSCVARATLWRCVCTRIEQPTLISF